MEGRSQDGLSVVPAGYTDPNLSPQALCVLSVLLRKGPAFSHLVSSSVKVCIPSTSFCSHSAPRASPPPLRPFCGDRFPLFSFPGSCPQLHRSLQALLGQDCTCTSHQIPGHGENLIRDNTPGSLSFPGGSLSNGGNTGITEAGKREAWHLLERRDSPRDQQAAR